MLGKLSWKEIARKYEEGEVTIDEVRENCGHVVVRQLLLAKYATERAKINSWPRVDYPPKFFISHKWNADNTVSAQSLELAETLVKTGAEIVFDQWWEKGVQENLELKISQLAESRVIYFIVTPEYFAHSHLASDSSSFRESWVEGELTFVQNVYASELEEHGEIGAVIEPVVLEFCSKNTTTWRGNQYRRFLSNTEWEKYLFGISQLRVRMLEKEKQESLKMEARDCAELFLSGRHNEAFSSLALLAGENPFVGDLSIMLTTMAKEIGDVDQALNAARLGVQHTEDWRWEHRWLKRAERELLEQLGN